LVLFMGFTIAGGGFHSWGLDAALLDEVRLGEIDGQRTARMERIAEVFRQARIKVDIQENILHWLWVHFAINCGIIAGGSKELLNSVSALRHSHYCMCDFIPAGRPAAPG
jgi:2-dehydropantoate 2-reductase